MKTLAKITAAIAITAGLLFGTLSPATAAPTNPGGTASYYWDCDTNGVRQCAGTLKGIGDAWESFDRRKPAPFYSKSKPLRYLKTYKFYPMVGKDSIVFRSYSQPSTWHVFTYRAA